MATMRSDGAPTEALPGELEALEELAAAAAAVETAASSAVTELRREWDPAVELPGEAVTAGLAMAMVADARRRDVGFGELIAAVAAAWKANRGTR